MRFVGIIDRIEDDLAYIIMQDGLFEISVSIDLLSKNQYNEGDLVTVSMDEKGRAALKGEEKYA